MSVALALSVLCVLLPDCVFYVFFSCICPSLCFCFSLLVSRFCSDWSFCSSAYSKILSFCLPASIFSYLCLCLSTCFSLSMRCICRLSVTCTFSFPVCLLPVSLYHPLSFCLHIFPCVLLALCSSPYLTPCFFFFFLPTSLSLPPLYPSSSPPFSFCFLSVHPSTSSSFCPCPSSACLVSRAVASLLS